MAGSFELVFLLQVHSPAKSASNIDPNLVPDGPCFFKSESSLLLTGPILAIRNSSCSEHFLIFSHRFLRRCWNWCLFFLEMWISVACGQAGIGLKGRSTLKDAGSGKGQEYQQKKLLMFQDMAVQGMLQCTIYCSVALESRTLKLPKRYRTLCCQKRLVPCLYGCKKQVIFENAQLLCGFNGASLHLHLRCLCFLLALPHTLLVGIEVPWFGKLWIH